MKQNLFFLLLFSCAISCKKSNSIPIDSVIRIDMIEMLDTAGGKPSLTLFCEEGEYSHTGFLLNYNVSKRDDIIKVSFIDVSDSHGGHGTSGPATARIPLGVLSNGSYALIFQNGQLQYKVLLTVSDSDYTISGPPVSYMTLLRHSLNKVPVNTVWGTISSDASRISSIDSIIDRLISYGAKPYAGPLGYYNSYFMGSYTIGAGMIMNPGSGDLLHRQIIYHYSGNYADLDSLVAKYKYMKYSAYLSGQH